MPTPAPSATDAPVWMRHCATLAAISPDAALAAWQRFAARIGADPDPALATQRQRTAYAVWLARGAK